MKGKWPVLGKVRVCTEQLGRCMGRHLPGSGVLERMAAESKKSQSLDEQLMPARVAAAYACAASPMVWGALSSSPFACIACTCAWISTSEHVGAALAFLR